MSCKVQNVPLCIFQGSNFNWVFQWAESTLTFKDITGITKAAPAVITAASHGVPDGWEVYVQSVQGMDEINSTRARVATLIASSTLSIPIDATTYTAYSSGGVLSYYTPVDLAGFDARAHFRASVSATGTPLIELDVSGGGIVLDNTAKTITLKMTAAETAALTWTRAVYDLEMESGTGVVTRIAAGAVTVSKEVTR